VELRTVAAAAAGAAAADPEARTLLVEVDCRIPVAGRVERRMERGARRAGIVGGWRGGPNVDQTRTVKRGDTKMTVKTV